MVYTKHMRQTHTSPPKKRIEIGAPFEGAINEILMPKTNTGNLSHNWSVTDWVRYAIAQQLIKAGNLPDDCREMLPRFYADLDI